MPATKRRVIAQKSSRWWLLVELVLVLAYANRVACAQIQVGSLTSLRGAAIIQRSGHSIAAAMAMPIMLGDKLQTSAESEATIALVDGSQLTLSESAAIVVDQSVVGPRPADSIINLFTGKLRSVINLRGGSWPDFEIHTPNAVAAARGTDFETEFIEGKPCPGFPQCLRYTDVGVYKGVVEVRNPTSATAPSVLVSSGFETTVPCELPPANPGPLGMGDLSAPGYH
jgi:hypothetical protein